MKIATTPKKQVLSLDDDDDDDLFSMVSKPKSTLTAGSTPVPTSIDSIADYIAKSKSSSNSNVDLF